MLTSFMFRSFLARVNKNNPQHFSVKYVFFNAFTKESLTLENHVIMFLRTSLVMLQRLK